MGSADPAFPFGVEEGPGAEPARESRSAAVGANASLTLFLYWRRLHAMLSGPVCRLNAAIRLLAVVYANTAKRHSSFLPVQPGLSLLSQRVASTIFGHKPALRSLLPRKIAL